MKGRHLQAARHCDLLVVVHFSLPEVKFSLSLVFVHTFCLKGERPCIKNSQLFLCYTLALPIWLIKRMLFLSRPCAYTRANSSHGQPLFLCVPFFEQEGQASDVCIFLFSLVRMRMGFGKLLFHILLDGSVLAICMPKCAASCLKHQRIIVPSSIRVFRLSKRYAELCGPFVLINKTQVGSVTAEACTRSMLALLLHIKFSARFQAAWSRCVHLQNCGHPVYDDECLNVGLKIFLHFHHMWKCVLSLL